LTASGLVRTIALASGTNNVFDYLFGSKLGKELNRGLSFVAAAILNVTLYSNNAKLINNVHILIFHNYFLPYSLAGSSEPFGKKILCTYSAFSLYMSILNLTYMIIATCSYHESDFNHDLIQFRKKFR
jgi:hypothetical protein